MATALNVFDPRAKRAGRPVPLGAAAFLRDTQHLSADEVGAYLLIIMAMWSRTECDFPDDDRRLARLCRISPRLWKARVGPAVRPFFDEAEGRLISAWLRAEAEQIERPYRDKQARALPNESSEAPHRGHPRRDPAQVGSSAQSSAATHPEPATAGADDDPAQHETILAAAGIDWTRDVTGKWLGSTQRWHVRRWREMGLTQEEILGVISESGPRGSPPGSLGYFDAAMQRACGRKLAPPLAPSASEGQHRRDALDRDAFFAALNRDG